VLLNKKGSNSSNTQLIKPCRNKLLLFVKNAPNSRRAIIFINGIGVNAPTGHRPNTSCTNKEPIKGASLRSFLTPKIRQQSIFNSE